MTSDPKGAELKRICDFLLTKPAHRRDSSELSGPGAARRIISYLGKQKDPLYRCDSEVLFLSALATPGEKESWNSGGAQVRKAFRDSTRRYVLDARDEIDNYYKTEGTPHGVKVQLPQHLNRTEPARKGAYGLRFVEVKADAEGPIETSQSRKSAAESFWGKLIVLERRSKAILIYPTDFIRLRNKHMDTRGLLSGSGEVAGAFAIGGSMGELWKRFEVRRSCDVGTPELQGASYLLLLGSSLKNQAMIRLREELLEDPCWPAQAFLFRELKKESGKMVGTICGTKTEYPYEVIIEREHEIDYALISYLRHSSGERTVVALQGISTVATRAAAEFLSKDACVTELQKKLGFSDVKTLPSFEVVLKVSLRGYVPSHVTIHDHFIHPNS